MMDAAVVAFVVLLFANVPAVAGRNFGLAAPVGAVTMLLIAAPALLQIAFRRRGLVVDIVWLLLMLFAGWLLVSTMRSFDTNLALRWVGKFASEVLLVYFLIINAVRSRATLRRAVWGLAVCATILSAMAIYQEFAHAPEQQFGGLALRDLERGPAVEAVASGALRRQREEVVLANRALGPIGDPNRFGQVLLYVLPLVAFRILDERTRRMRFCAAACSAAIAGGVFLTYSRGTLLALGLLVFIALLFRYLRWLHVIPAVVLGGLLVGLVAPGSRERLQSIEAIPALLSNRSYSSIDGAVRGRLTEMLAARNAFMDHPVFGVGPGHYSTYYSVEYMSDPKIAYRALVEPRRAHNLYLEMAAETGAVGLALFLVAVGWLLYSLELRRRRWRGVRPELEHYAAGFFLAVVSYGVTAVFLHLSFQIYLGLFLGMAGAAAQILAPRTSAGVAAPARIEGRRDRALQRTV